MTGRPALYLGSALVLSFAAVASVALAPAPLRAPPPPAHSQRAGPVKLDVKLSHGAVAAAGDELYAEYSLSVDDDAFAGASQAISLALVLDRSGSMEGEKMSQTRAAAHRLVDLLEARDELAFITFSDSSEELPALPMTPENKARVHAAIDATVASGAPHVGDDARAFQARGARRLVLVSDGRPTMGTLGTEALSTMVDQLNQTGITLTALGVGDDFDGPLMQRLAERGGGMYGYLQDAARLPEVLNLEVLAARTPSLGQVTLTLRGAGLRVEEAPLRSLLQVHHDTWALHLIDLRPGLRTRVLLRLRSTQLEPGAQGHLLAELGWSPPEGQDGLPRQVAVEAPVLAVELPEEAQRTRDEALWSQGVEAAGSQRLVAAAEAYARGDDRVARSLLSGARSLFALSADALAGEARVSTLQRDFEMAAPQQRKSGALRESSKSLQNFGEANGY